MPASASSLAGRSSLGQGPKVFRLPCRTPQVRFTNGDKFEGQYAGNRKHGFGTYCWADGAAEEGQWLCRIVKAAANIVRS